MSEKQPIKIKLESEEAKEKDKNGKLVTIRNPQTKEARYTRNDLVGLMALLGRFNTTIHPLKDWKQSIKVKDRLTNAYKEDLKEVELTLDEAAFLKLYLQELPNKEGKEKPLPDFELRTLIGTQEQLE